MFGRIFRTEAIIVQMIQVATVVHEKLKINIYLAAVSLSGRRGLVN